LVTKGRPKSRKRGNKRKNVIKQWRKTSAGGGKFKKTKPLLKNKKKGGKLKGA